MWKIDSTLDYIMDQIGAYVAAAFAADEEQKRIEVEKFLTDFYPKYCERMQNRLKKNTSQNHIVGESFTIADFALAGSAFSIFYN